MVVIDLTQALNLETPVYADADGYHDPAYQTQLWSTIADQGYSVHRLEMGTHTGTHLDAPAHFHAQGRTVDQILPSALLGPATVIDVRRWCSITGESLRPYAQAVNRESVLLFLAPDGGILLAREAVALVAAWHPKLILYSGQFLDEGERFHHNRVWLGADIPLVTDLAPLAAAEVRDGDLLVVAPLLLEDMDGAPCRVFALRLATER